MTDLFPRILAAATIFAMGASGSCSCSVARADDSVSSADGSSSSADRSTARLVALEHYEARKASGAIDVGAAELCEGGIAWARTASATICTKECMSNQSCGTDERCRVLPQGAKAEDAAIYLDSEAVPELADAAEVDLEPVCEGNCEPYTGDVVIRPTRVLALCEPALFQEFAARQ